MYVGDSPVIPTLASLQYLCTPLANLVSGIHPRSCFLNRPLAFLGLTMDQNPRVISEGPRAGLGAAFLLAYGPAKSTGFSLAWQCASGAASDGKWHPGEESGAALCLGQASCAGLGSGAGPAGHRHSVLGMSQAGEQGSCSFTALHLLSRGWPQRGGCWGGPEPPLCQQLRCLARGWGCAGRAQSPAAACGGHWPGASPAWAAGLGRGPGGGERWAGAGLGWAVPGRGHQQRQGAVAACRGGLPAGLGAAEPGLGKGAQSCRGRGHEAARGPCWPGQSRKGAQGIRPLTAACHDLHGAHGASRARLCPVVRRERAKPL